MFSLTRGPSTRWSRSYSLAVSKLLLLVMLALPCITPEGRAQVPTPDTVIPRKPIYGVGLDEMWIGGRLATYPSAGRMDSIWNFADELGLSIWEMLGGNIVRFDSLVQGARQGHRVISNRPDSLERPGYGIDRAGNSREAVFFPFDSAESYYYRNVFVERSAGVSGNNAVVSPDGLQERIYGINQNTTANQVVLSKIAFGYDPARHIRRYPISQYDGFVQNSSAFVTNRLGELESPNYFIELQGHLFHPFDQGGGANDNDTLLVIEIWIEVPKGAKYFNSFGATMTAASDMEVWYRNFAVRKSQLTPLAQPNPAPSEYFKYRTVTIPVNFHRYTGLGGNSCGGPVHPDNETHRFDVRVKWTGKEKLAVRSVTLRDWVAQHLAGTTPADTLFRYNLRQHARRAVYGPSHQPPVRNPVIRFYSGDEGRPFENAGYRMIDTILAREFPTGDAQTMGIRAWRAQSQHTTRSQHSHILGDELTVETYFYDVFHRPDSAENYARYQITDVQPPSLAIHNGGRFRIPLMDTTIADVERYTKAVQRIYIGGNMIDGPVHWPYDASWANELGNAAWSSRRTGRRIVQWPGTMSPINLIPKYHPDTSIHQYLGRELSVSHIPEASEMRVCMNLGLCYGTRGVHYPWVGSDTGEYYTWAPPWDSVKKQGKPWWDQTERFTYYNDFGPVGPLTNQRENHRTPMIFYAGPDRTDTVNTFYTGWGNRLDEMIFFGRNWLPKIGAAMARLQWRDGFSYHFTQLQSWMLDNPDEPQTRQRVMPDSMIVKRVEARSRTGVLDPQAETYVELGFFDKWTGANGYDTNHIFVVNRRTFERPGDVAANTPLGRKLDTLAEVRTLAIQLRHLPHPDTEGYNFIRVREVAADSTPLPLSGVAFRQPLDTIIRSDSTIRLSIRPGGAALLQITYCLPNDSLAFGDIRFNSQRKTVFDGNYWHAVYFRPLTYWKPPTKDSLTTQNVVYYRRSLPVTPATGAIRWDPRPEFEVLLTDTSNANWYLNNRFPSLTVRADSSVIGDTVVTAVWTCYSRGWTQGFTVLTRNVKINGNDGTPQTSAVDSVGFAHGTNDTIVGVPVVSRLHGGEMFAWGDAQAGILARFRRLKAGPIATPGWWQAPWTYSALDSVSWPNTFFDGPGRYPSMPAFAHVAGRDSSIAIVWQQPANSGSTLPTSQIQYARIAHTTIGGLPAIMTGNQMQISQNDGKWHRHPSIDMTQDVWYGAQEGVTWESSEYFWDQLKGWWAAARPRVHFASIWTETSRACSTGGWRPFHDCIEGPWRWTYNTLSFPLVGLNGQGYGADVGFQYPNTSSTNTRHRPADSSQKILFSVALSKTTTMPMRQTLVEYATNFLWPQPKTYTHNGHYPNGSASGTKQSTRHAAIFQQSADSTMHGMAGALETTREYFAKERPRGYMAHGRQVHFRLSDSVRASILGMLHDVWFAGDAGTGALALADRSGMLSTDSITDVQTLFRSEYFRTHDSTTIGFQVGGALVGDTSIASGMHVEFVAELVDSATDQAIAVLDSFRIGSNDTLHDATIRSGFDLLSGTYYVRLRIEPFNVTVEQVPYASLHPVEEISEWIEEEPLAKVRRLDDAATGGRITAYPNPVQSMAEIRFSVPKRERVWVRVFDRTGREAMKLLDGKMMEEGRYAIDLDAQELPAGAYLLELRYGMKRIVGQVVVMR